LKTVPETPTLPFNMGMLGILYTCNHPTSDCVFYLYEFAKKAKTILELGVGRGVSTLALLSGAQETGGILYSVDINPCNDVIKNVSDVGLSPYWHFTCMNDLEYVQRWNGKPIDLLFIDTLHTEEQTFQELCSYAPLSKNILLHDTLEKGICEGILYGVSKAIRKYLKHDSSFEYIEFGTKHGLGWMRRK